MLFSLRGPQILLSPLMDGTGGGADKEDGDDEALDNESRDAVDSVVDDALKDENDGEGELSGGGAEDEDTQGGEGAAGADDEQSDGEGDGEGKKPETKAGAKPAAKPVTIEYGGYQLTPRQVTDQFDTFFARQRDLTGQVTTLTADKTKLEAQVAELQAELESRPEPEEETNDPTLKRLRAIEKANKKAEREKADLEKKVASANRTKARAETAWSAVSGSAKADPAFKDIDDEIKSVIFKALRWDMHEAEGGDGKEIPPHLIAGAAAKILKKFDTWGSARVAAAFKKINKNKPLAHGGGSTRAGGGKPAAKPSGGKAGARVPNFSRQSDDLSDIIDVAFEDAFAEAAE